MQLTFLKSKIHRATVTDANLHYEGSITLGRELLDTARIAPFEKVEIYNITNGERFATYAIEGAPGTCCLNGAAAWKARVNDRIIIATYVIVNEEEAKTLKPTLVFVGPENQIVKVTSQYGSAS